MAHSERAEPRGSALLTLQEAADALNVHYMTAYRWVRKGDLPAFKAGGRLRVRADDLRAFLSDRLVDTALPGQASRRTDWALHAERLYDLLREGAAADAAALTRKIVADGASVGDVYVRVVTPVLHRIGEGWAQGALTISEEHRATEIAAATVTRLGEHFRRRGPSRGEAVTLTPAGEQHGLGAAMAAHFLRGMGYEVHHLGTDVPAEDLRRFLGGLRADVLGVSVTRTDLTRAALPGVVAAGRQTGVRLVVVGGQGADAQAVADLGGLHVAELVDLPRRLGEHPAA